jgi:hypothetical protein
MLDISITDKGWKYRLPIPVWGGGYFTCSSNDFYLPSRRLEGGGGSATCDPHSSFHQLMHTINQILIILEASGLLSFSCKGDLPGLAERLTDNAKVASVRGSMPASSETVKLLKGVRWSSVEKSTLKVNIYTYFSNVRWWVFSSKKLTISFTTISSTKFYNPAVHLQKASV